MPCSTATFVPRRSATLSMPSLAMILSLPVELSLTRTIFSLAPPLAEAMVSLRVWLLASITPLDSALMLSV